MRLKFITANPGFDFATILMTCEPSDMTRVPLSLVVW